MIQWKGNTSSEAGAKARRLDSLQGFNVPNFFVITSEGINQLLKSETDPEHILNTSMDSEARKEIKEAYDEVGMSSEVRKASGKAKSLVGGQRNNQFVSVRVSDSGREEYDYKLNVGSSNLFNAIKEVVASYRKEKEGFPSIIVQKMVEPGYTATVQHFNDFTLIESVKGLGTSLEEGLTVPGTFIVGDEGLKESFMPGEQLEITRSPVRAGNQRRKIETESNPFERREIENLAVDARETGFNLKVVYKRGSFHVVDAYRSSTPSDPVIEKEGVRVSPGKISGVIGQEVTFTERTLPPEEFREALICTRGGYTSRDGYRIRESGKPAIFRFSGELREGQRIELGQEQIQAGSRESFKTYDRKQQEASEEKNSFNPFKGSEDGVDSVTGSEVLPVDPRTGRGVCIQRKSDRGFVVTDRETEAVAIPQKGLIEAYRDFFTCEEDHVVVDSRRMDFEGLVKALEFIEAEIKILVIDELDREILRSALENGFRVFGVPEASKSDFQRLVDSEERRFIMDRLDEID